MSAVDRPNLRRGLQGQGLRRLRNSPLRLS